MEFDTKPTYSATQPDAETTTYFQTSEQTSAPLTIINDNTTTDAETNEKEASEAETNKVFTTPGLEVETSSPTTTQGKLSEHETTTREESAYHEDYEDWKETTTIKVISSTVVLNSGLKTTLGTPENDDEKQSSIVEQSPETEIKTAQETTTIINSLEETMTHEKTTHGLSNAEETTRKEQLNSVTEVADEIETVSNEQTTIQEENSSERETTFVQVTTSDPFTTPVIETETPPQETNMDDRIELNFQL